MPPPLQVDLRPFDLESGVRVTCDVGYLCANLPSHLCSRPRPDLHDRQTDIRRASSLNGSWSHVEDKLAARRALLYG